MSSTILPPAVHTYHCICTSILLATTHTLSRLPRRAPPSLDAALILPLPASPPTFSVEYGEEGGGSAAVEEEIHKDMPAEGYSRLLGMVQDTKTTIVRREDGFERRLLYRCGRCAVVVGYEVLGGLEGNSSEGYAGRIVYLLPAGMVSTQVMARGGLDEKGERWVDEDKTEIVKLGAVPVFE